MALLLGVFLVLAGLVLCVNVLHFIPRFGATLERFAKALQRSQTLLGLVCLIVAILNILSLGGIVLLLAALVLAVNVLHEVPSIGDDLVRFAKHLAGVQVPLGIVAIVLGFLAIL